jgi:hypothetical protein
MPLRAGCRYQSVSSLAELIWASHAPQKNAAQSFEFVMAVGSQAFWQHGEARLCKMTIGGQRFPKLQYMHDNKARTVRERILL